MNTDVVSVSAPARLHLGFLDLHGGLGRRFGGIGLALDAPATRLTLAAAEEDGASASGPDAGRAADALRALAAALGIPLRHRLTVAEAIPSHQGLGSGTQMALAVAAALRTLHRLPLNPEGDAQTLGRGERSGLGAGFFARGGLAVDGGKGAADRPPPVVARLPFPEDWRVLLVLDRRRRGVHGAAETEAFRRLPPFPERDAADICRLVLLGALPALAEHDIAGFGRALAAIQERIGRHFAPAQGGIFASPLVAAAMERLAAAGAHGIGQSSWGPTGFAFAETEAAARALAGGLAGGGADGLDIRIARGRNEGAALRRHTALAAAGRAATITRT